MLLERGGVFLFCIDDLMKAAFTMMTRLNKNTSALIIAS